jgi:hypothetical protein
MAIKFCVYQTNDEPDYCQLHSKRCPYTFENISLENIAEGIKIGKRDEEGNLIEICKDFSLSTEE